jgi:hypothetical protein
MKVSGGNMSAGTSAQHADPWTQPLHMDRPLHIERSCRVATVPVCGGVAPRQVHGVVFVVDAADKDRLPEACTVLKDTLASAQLADKPLLVFANKQVWPLGRIGTAMHGAWGRPTNRGHPVSCNSESMPDIVKCFARVPFGCYWVVE